MVPAASCLTARSPAGHCGLEGRNWDSRAEKFRRETLEWTARREARIREDAAKRPVLSPPLPDLPSISYKRKDDPSPGGWDWGDLTPIRNEDNWWGFDSATGFFIFWGVIALLVFVCIISFSATHHPY